MSPQRPLRCLLRLLPLFVHARIVNRTAETVVRLLPPLNITEAEANEAINRLDAALGAVGAA